ncbi:MAG: FAD-dependent oxidoreductase, partial [Gammaproteobacteria bacterium]|nr:FAD-dependent oxidoreductase [Gammaproteobacteria bacterium]
MGERIDDGLSLNEFRELLQVSGLERLDRRFLEYLESRDAALHARLLDYRHANAPLTALQTSELLLALAPLLEVFVARVFGIEPAVADLRARTLTHNEVMAFKQEFVLRRARHYRGAVTQSFAELDDWLSAQIERMGIDASDVELAVARYGRQVLGDPTANAQAIEQLTRWCALALKDPAGRARVASWACFRLPQRTDYARLVPVRKLDGDPVGRLQGDPGHLRRRDGFALTDPRMPPRDIQSEVHYCIYCHDHDGDFCSKGFPAKKGSPELGLLVNPLGVTLTGCPLEEKISEMHVLKRDGMSIAALAMIMVDNPLVPATGHRICNDCMKSCIYQKQDPVDIPQIETAVLTDVLGLPWGVEIYDLLTRWNPLRRRQYLPKPYNGRKVLIVGQGPAGFAMAHYLSMEGCAVVGTDGLKIEPLPEALLTAPVRDYSALVEPLDRRVMAGFGGVAEYGITVRWDKNFLKLIYLSLMRRPTFQAFGGVRLGGTLMIEDAWRLGFDHVCIATGAGLPRVIPMGNSLARGMRQASDFLMALQLTGAAKRDSLANLQVRLPAVVIGGGLTAVDTATEVQAYYIVQVEKTLERYERLIEVRGEQGVRAAMDTESLATLDEFLAHGRAARAERQRAARTGEAPDFTALLRAWGGATIVYRRGMNESPAYTRNHEEVTKALEEGIYYAEGLEPVHAKLDAFGHIQALICRRRVKSQDGRWLTTGEELSLPARSVLVAAGAIPNTIYEHEHSGTLILDGDHFLPHILDQTGLQPVEVATHCKAPEFGPFTSYHKHERRVSFIGDTHPVFHGSVVKAIASAQRSYPQIMAALERLPAPDAAAGDYDGFRARIAD